MEIPGPRRLPPGSLLPPSPPGSPGFHTAGSQSADDLGLIARTDLTQFNPAFEHRRQLLEQLAEINPFVCDIDKNDFAAVQRVFTADQIHLQVQPLNRLLALHDRAFGQFPVLSVILPITPGRSWIPLSPASSRLTTSS